MIEPNQLLQTYIRQYQAASKKKRKTSSRPRDLSERTNRLFKTLKRTKPTQVTSLSLEEWHRQIKNLAYFAYRSHNDAVTKLIETSLLPQLIRLDEAMFLPAQRDDISVDFLNYLETELDGQLCTQTLLELYQIYKRYVIQYKIMDLVPSRPELEFPDYGDEPPFHSPHRTDQQRQNISRAGTLKNSEKGHLPRSAAPSGA